MERLSAALDALLVEIAEHPTAARFALVEAPAAGEVAREAVGRAHNAFERAVLAELRRAAGGPSLSLLPLARGIVSGLVSVLQMRLLEPGSLEIAGLGSELLEWMLAYDPRQTGALGEAAFSARPAPSSLPHRSQTRLGGLAGDERTRMLNAAARLAAAGGVQSLTSGQIVQAAGADPDAFAREFAGVEQCFLAAFELVGAEALVRALRESGDTLDWAACVCRVLAALIAQAAGDPVLARIAFAEILVAGVPGIERRASLVRGFAAFLARRVPRSCRPGPVTAEAIVGSVWGLVGHAALHSHSRELHSLAPYAAYLALAPILGANRAVETICREFAGSTGDLIAA